VCRKKISKRSQFRVSALAGLSSVVDADGDTGGVMGMQVRGDFGTKVNALVRYLKYQDELHDRRLARRAAGGAASAASMLEEDDGGSDEPDYKPKALVYSQWDMELVLVSKALAMNGIQYVELRGSLQQRSGAVHRFNKDPGTRAFLLATGEANAGLTLVAATSVFLLEPSLNPAIEEQAINRIHRIGQTRQTTVYRFVVADSVEETILDLQAKKRSLVGEATAAEEDAAARRWEKEAGENAVLSELNDAILSPRKNHPAEAQDDPADVDV
jgi:SNF2 family DNA or RNA helicase